MYDHSPGIVSKILFLTKLSLHSSFHNVTKGRRKKENKCYILLSTYYAIIIVLSVMKDQNINTVPVLKLFLLFSVSNRTLKISTNTECFLRLYS